MERKRAAFFLDRDGTINFDYVYLNDPERLELIPGSAAAIRRAREAGYLVVVVSNQSGVGRGIIALEALTTIHRRLDKLLEKEGAAIDSYQLCLHTPQDHCDCRKPQPKMVLRAAEDLGIDLGRSFFVGDMLTDIRTGKNAGCGKTILVRTAKPGHGEVLQAQLEKLTPPERPDHIARDLSAAVDWALSP